MALTTYKIDMHCTNCGHKGEVEVPKGQPHSSSAIKCPICECLTYKFGWF